ncbi:9086_t:CDS:2, partial [Gigaspora margarita]
GKFITLAKLVFVLCKTIKWTYSTPSLASQSSSKSNNNSNQAKKRRRQELEHIAKKFNSHSPSTQHTYKKPLQTKPDTNSNSTTSNLSFEQIRINQLQETLQQMRKNSTNHSTQNNHTNSFNNKGKKPMVPKDNLNKTSPTPLTSNDSTHIFDNSPPKTAKYNTEASTSKQ